MLSYTGIFPISRPPKRKGDKPNGYAIDIYEVIAAKLGFSTEYTFVVGPRLVRARQFTF